MDEKEKGKIVQMPMQGNPEQGDLQRLDLKDRTL